MNDPAANEPTLESSQVIPGAIRTLVPLIAGEVVAIAADLGFDLNPGIARIVGIVGAIAYYIVMRRNELKGRSWATRALGSKSTPTFTKGG